MLEPTDSRAPRTWAVVATAKPKAGRPCGGFTYGDLERGGDWNQAVAASGLSRTKATVEAIVKLLFWHVAQPVLYCVAFVEWDPKDVATRDAQMNFGLAVGFREVTYLLLVLATAVVNPAYLLVDVGATMRSLGTGDYADWESGPGFVAMYTVAPEKFVGMALFGDRGGNMLKLLVLFMLGPVLDLCGLAALGLGLGAGDLSGALAVGYTVTTLGVLCMMAIVLQRNGWSVQGTEGKAVVMVVLFVLLPAFGVPFLVGQLADEWVAETTVRLT